MVLPELPNGALIGLGFALAGVSFWVIGIYVVARLLGEYGPKQAVEQETTDRD